MLKPCLQSRKRNFLYVVTEFIDGQTLAQWMIDNPKPDLETVRGIVEQIAKGLRAFHRKEMLHQDLRPDNVMIDKTGTVKIIDFGSTGSPASSRPRRRRPRRHPRHLAVHRAGIFPRRDAARSRSDLFSLGVITYQMLTGRLPYGAQMAQTRTQVAAAQTDIPPGARMTTARSRPGSTAC